MQCFCRKFGFLFQNIAKVVLQKVVKELKLAKVAVTSRYWSQALLRRSMTVDQPTDKFLEKSSIVSQFRHLQKLA